MDATRVGLAIDDDRLSMSAGCDIMSGEFSIDASTLVLSEMSMTEMGCDETLRAQDGHTAAG